MIGKQWIRLFLVCLGLAVILFAPAAQSQSESYTYIPLIQVPSSFEQLSMDLAAMHDLWSRPSNRLVQFDSAAARQQGFAEESITLAEELTGFTNDLVVGAEQAEIDPNVPGKMFDKAFTYTNMVKYLQEASMRAKSGITLQAITPAVSLAEWQCGSPWNPMPNPAANWIDNIPDPDPVAKIKSMGFHETPDWAGGGFTRPQTWNVLWCHEGAFRDQAIFDPKKPGVYKLQEYTGITPNGEPNPEINAYLWPYDYWPAYAAWWHYSF